MALVINPHGGEHLKTVYQHQPTFQKSNCLRCVNADTRRIRKNTALFHLFSHLFQFSVLTKIQRGADYSGPKAQRNWGRMARNTQQWICRVCTRTAKTDFLGKKTKRPSTFVGWYFFRAPWASKEKSLPTFHHVSFFMIIHHLSSSYLRFEALLINSLLRLVFMSHGVLSVHASSSLPLQRSKLNKNPGINSE